MTEATFTYDLEINGALVGEPDVKVSYDSFGYHVEVYDYRGKGWVPAGRDWSDRIMTWAHANRPEELDEMRREHQAGQRTSEIIANAAE